MLCNISIVWLTEIEINFGTHLCLCNRREHWKLLSNLKTTVEGLLSTNNPNVWSRYGGLQRLHKDMTNILSHGLKHEQVWTQTKLTTHYQSLVLHRWQVAYTDNKSPLGKHCTGITLNKLWTGKSRACLLRFSLASFSLCLSLYLSLSPSLCSCTISRKIIGALCGVCGPSVPISLLTWNR